MSAALTFAAVSRLLIGKLAIKPFNEDIRESEAECADGTPLYSGTKYGHDVTYWMWYNMRSA
jgi:hypothetical protein